MVEDHTVRWVVLCFHTVHRLILIAVYENSICLKDFQPDILNSFLRSFDLCLRLIFLLLAWWINGWLALQRCQHLCFNYSICWGDTEDIWKWHFSCFSDQITPRRNTASPKGKRMQGVKQACVWYVTASSVPTAFYIRIDKLMSNDVVFSRNFGLKML